MIYPLISGNLMEWMVHIVDWISPSASHIDAIDCNWGMISDVVIDS